MGMTKADRLEFDQRRNALDHWAQLTLDSCLQYGLTSKSKWLAEQREKDAAFGVVNLAD